MAKTIIGIHGLANKPPRDVQRDGWIHAMREGLDACGTSKPLPAFVDVYWADLLYTHPLHRNAGFEFDDLYDDEPYEKALPGAIKSYKAGYIDEVRKDLQAEAGALTERVKATLGVDVVADLVLSAKLKDLAFYYDDSRRIAGRDRQTGPARDLLQAELVRELRAHKGDEIMLIAHSMGSIIAYDVLRGLGQEDPHFELARFVTLGSPLGLPHVKIEAGSRYPWDPVLRTPTIVAGSWINFADKKDPVAFDPHLADDFGPNKRGVHVRDRFVLNDYACKGKRNRHKLFGYLRTPEFSAELASFL